MEAQPSVKIIIAPGSTLLEQTWWPQLHSLINESYQNKSHASSFPPSWSRLNLDPTKGGEELSGELGDHGHITIVFSDDDEPIACGGALPFRGENWISENFQQVGEQLDKTAFEDGKIKDWETCCWCVHPSARRRGIPAKMLDRLIPLLKAKGGETLYTNYILQETGTYWSKLGFELVPGVGGKLPKGYKPHLEWEEELAADVFFGMSVRQL